jgi:hypothetical protein
MEESCNFGENPGWCFESFATFELIEAQPSRNMAPFRMKMTFIGLKAIS